MEGIGYLIRMFLGTIKSTIVTVILIGLFAAGVVLGYGLLGVVAVVAFVWIILYGIYSITASQVLKWRSDWFF